MSDTHWWALQVIGTHYMQSMRVVRITETVYKLGRVTFLSSVVGFESKASHVLGKFYHNHCPNPFALVVLRQGFAKLLLWSFNLLSSHIYLELVILHLSFPSVANIGVCYQTWLRLVQQTNEVTETRQYL